MRFKGKCNLYVIESLYYTKFRIHGCLNTPLIIQNRMEPFIEGEFKSNDRFIEDADNDPTKLYITYESLFPHGLMYLDTKYIPLKDGTYHVKGSVIRADNKHAYDDVTIENFRIKKFVKYCAPSHSKTPYFIQYFSYMRDTCYEVRTSRYVGEGFIRSATIFYKDCPDELTRISDTIIKLQGSPNIKQIILGKHGEYDEKYSTIDILFYPIKGAESADMGTQ